MVTSREAKLGPVEMRTSEELRLKRVSRNAIYKTATKQLVLPIATPQIGKAAPTDHAQTLVTFLQTIFPPDP
jgi:hypothetical protein